MRAPGYTKLLGHLKFRQLALLVAVDEHRTLHRAAGAVLMTQPTATNAVRDVEKLFGCALFERLPRGMRPTRLGVEVLGFTKELESKRNGNVGQLVIGVVKGSTTKVFAQALIEIKRRCPELPVKWREDSSDDAIAALVNGDTDIAVGRFSNVAHRKDLSYEFMGGEPVCIVGRHGHPLTHVRDVQLRDLEHCAWVLPPLSCPVREALEGEFAEAGMRSPANIVECPSIFETLGLIQATDAITVLPVSAAADGRSAGSLISLPVLVGRRLAGLGLLMRREPLGEAAATFVELLRRHRARERSDAGPHELGSSHGQNGVDAPTMRPSPDHRW
jgi:DNA-binding transcriptional LysR family regulator